MTEHTRLEPPDTPAGSDTSEPAAQGRSPEGTRSLQPVEAGALPGATAAGEATPADQPEPPEDLAELRRQRDEYYELLLRKAAEFDNYRKRVERERRERADAAAVDLLLDLLPIIDDLERALTAEAGSDGEGYRRGVEMIHRKLTEMLGRRGVTPIEAVGAVFDPHLHQAVVHEVSPDHREGEIIEEYRRGYKIGDQLLRPSMVKVAKA